MKKSKNNIIGDWLEKHGDPIIQKKVEQEARELMGIVVDFSSEKSERIIFHFNKAHNQDQTIPQWIVKHKGQTYYVNHLDSEVGFKTKETPDNDHTKGSLQFKGKLLIESVGDVKTAIIRK